MISLKRIKNIVIEKISDSRVLVSVSTENQHGTLVLNLIVNSETGEIMFVELRGDTPDEMPKIANGLIGLNIKNHYYLNNLLPGENKDVSVINSLYYDAFFGMQEAEVY